MEIMTAPSERSSKGDDENGVICRISSFKFLKKTLDGPNSAKSRWRYRVSRKIYIFKSGQKYLPRKELHSFFRIKTFISIFRLQFSIINHISIARIWENLALKLRSIRQGSRQWIFWLKHIGTMIFNMM